MGQVKTTPAEAILGETNLPTVATRSVQLSATAYEKSLRQHTGNPRLETAGSEVRERTKKPSWRQKARQTWRSIFGDRRPTTKPELLPPWLETGSHTFETTGTKSGDVVADKKWATQRLEEGRHF